MAQVPTRPSKVAIDEDGTLRPGDAVMMSDGLSIFAGSKSWPCRPADVTSRDGAKDVGKQIARVFGALDRMPWN